MGWERANQLKVVAVSHTAKMNREYKEEIERAVSNTVLYDNENLFVTHEVSRPKFIVDDRDSVYSIFKQRDNGVVTVLNFASYKEPGGGFIRGAMAQEEALCHASFLYNVLKQFPGYYTWNTTHKNKGMYLDRALYTPNVRFFKDKLTVMANVITCAAPNKSVSLKYGNFSERENTQALDKRIEFIAKIANEQHSNVLILGAYGCGVFCNDPKEVAELFKKHLSDSPIERIVFSIPDKKNRQPFEEVFS